uniref:Down syndrome cell adhesion molecule-like protein 1 n=1 Tax=Dermatophagoides pteronyssinus TaxID=6956 RepID=A0A6P6YK10_DERPT|nr:Down syndrome cell adhesion molecule-like protein 1 [Dermatophagoides pteronyssinus]
MMLIISATVIHIAQSTITIANSLSSQSSSSSLPSPLKSNEKSGPEFLVEPPSSVIFLNDTGSVITCSAKGIPAPTITWTRADGTPLIQIPGLRQIRKDLLTTQLVYLPFSATSYRQDVHSGIVRCVATNQVGSIQSQDVNIRASVRQSYEIQVYDDFAIKGNTGILRCHIPSFVREYVHVTNWLRYGDDDDRPIISDLLKGGRYSVMPNGELHVHRIENDDNDDDDDSDDNVHIIDNNKNDRHHHHHKQQQKQRNQNSHEQPRKLMFRCQTKHMLSGNTKLSANYGRLIVTEPQTNMPPKIITTAPTISTNSGSERPIVIANVGQTIELSCVAQAQPWPSFTWYRIKSTSNDLQSSSHHSLLSPLIDGNKLQRLQVWTFQVPPNNRSIDMHDKNELLNGEQYITPYRLSRAGRFVQVDSSLFIRDVAIADSGIYVCVANNSLGEDRIEMELVVKAPLSVTMTPSYILASDGDNVAFNCTITGGSPIQQIHWRRNARPLMAAQAITASNRQHANHRVHLSHNDRLLQIRQVRREDRGMFQCIVSNEFESVQASGELALADDPPTFITVFTITEPLRPGVPLSIKCSATGTPLPQIVWTLDGAPLLENGRIRIGDYVNGDGIVNSFVNISSLRTEDGGIYSCTASNDVHSISHSGRINVYGPAFVRQMKNLTAISGHTVHLHCPAAGYPLESIVWFKKSSPSDQGSRLPQNHRHKSLLNGTLVIEKVERNTDEGAYRCVVTGPNGASSASAELFIRILVAPVISPFNPPPNLREGMRVMLTCSVVEGDSPVLIHFLKDGEPIHDTHSTSASRRIKLDVTNEFSATLYISSVIAEDSGNYTCIASNMAAVTTYSIVVKVNVPPKWKIPPTDTEAIQGQNVVIDCSASGEPRIWWERAHDKSSSLASSSKLTSSSIGPADGEPASIVHFFRTVVSNSHMHTLENGSLMIRDVSEEDSGVYLCQANNGVGSGLSKVITLKVHVPAHFKSKFSAHTVQRGESIEFACEAYGEFPVSMQVAKDRMPLDFGSTFDRLPSDPLLEQQILHTDNRYHLLRRVTGQSDRAITSYIVRIANVDRRDSSLFTCLASNNFGKDEYNFQLIVQEPPGKPENVHVLELDSRSAVVAWSQPYSGNSPIIAYHVEYRQWLEILPSWHHLDATTNLQQQNINEQNGKLHQPSSKPAGTIFRQTLIGTESSISLRSLKPMTTYEVRVQAENKLGLGPFQMPPLKITTKEEAPSGPPLNIHVYPSSAHSLQVTFHPPRIEHQNGQILGYYVGYKAIDLDEHFMFKKVVEEKSSQPSTQNKEVKISDLRRATKYLVIVQAFNRIGPGPQSEEVIGETLVNDPPRAPILTSVNVNYDSVELSWSIEAADDSYAAEQQTSNSDVPEITGYFLYAKSSQSGEWKERQVDSQQNSYTFTNLLCGTQYQFYVIAYNNVGKGDPSQAIAVRTKGSVPIAPKNWNSFITVNSTVALIRLDAWLVNGCDIKYFVLKYRPRMDSEWLVASSKISPREQRFVELVDLRPATWYLLNMAALTDIGTTEETYMFATLTMDGETIPPLETISRTLTSENSISASSGSMGSSGGVGGSNTLSSMQSLTIVIPATCSVIVLTVIILVACFVLGTKRSSQQFESTILSAIGARNGSSNSHNHTSINGTPSHIHAHISDQLSTTYCPTTATGDSSNEPRYSTGLLSNNLDNYGFCPGNNNLNNGIASAKCMINGTPTMLAANNSTNSIEMIHSAALGYATLKKQRTNIQTMKSILDSDIKNLDLSKPLSSVDNSTSTAKTIVTSTTTCLDSKLCDLNKITDPSGLLTVQATLCCNNSNESNDNTNTTVHYFQTPYALSQLPNNNNNTNNNNNDQFTNQFNAVNNDNNNDMENDQIAELSCLNAAYTANNTCTLRPNIKNHQHLHGDNHHSHVYDLPFPPKWV